MHQKENSLFGLRNKIEKELNEFFDNKIEQAGNQKKPGEFLEMIRNIKIFTLNGGKRIRSILFCYGYLIAGGEKKEDILKASISVELIHSYLLIHDDIIDEDDFRRHNLSMHHIYEKKYKNRFKNNYKKRRLKAFNENEIKQFGISMAIVTGDLASSLGYEILNRSNFSTDLKIKAIKKLNQVVSNTITGEAMDVILAVRQKDDSRDILKMQEYKTARYTIEGPLHLGAILAGADENFLKSISKFAIPLGIAFQIQDDIIGVFESKEKTGKPAGGDIKEGKKTFLSTKAFEKADDKQLETLSGLFGNKNISPDEIDDFREIIKKTGSLDYSLEKINSLVRSSKAHLEKMKISENDKERLLELADFVAKKKD